MKSAKHTPEPFEPDFDYADEMTTKEALETVESFYNAKLKPLGDDAPRDSIAGTVEITQKEKKSIWWIAYQMREIQNARSKGGASGGGGRKPSKNPSQSALYQRERRKKLKQNKEN